MRSVLLSFVILLATPSTATAYPVQSWYERSHVDFSVLYWNPVVDDSIDACVAPGNTFIIGEVAGCITSPEDGDTEIAFAIHLSPAQYHYGNMRQVYYHEMCHAFDEEGMMTNDQRNALKPLLGYDQRIMWQGPTGWPSPKERFAEACGWIAMGRWPRASDNPTYGLKMNYKSYYRIRRIIKTIQGVRG
jgi:hypothetical protein